MIVINNIIKVIGLSHKKLGEPSLINSDLLNVSSISPPSTKANIKGGMGKSYSLKKAVSYTHLPSPRDKRQSRMPSSA